jgi:DNA-binding NtrC family response regulator
VNEPANSQITAAGEPARARPTDDGTPPEGAPPDEGGERRVVPSFQLNILVVDDEESVREFFEVFLAQDGHRVRTLSDPTTALSALRDDEYHVVILDLMMPKLSGMDLLEQVRKADDDIAIVICTGFPSIETATTSIVHEVSAYIKKPFDIEEFRGVIQRIAKKKGLVLRREDELHRTIGRIIREQRKARGLTLKQMARRTNLSVSLLSQIERAESSASVSSLFKVATALDVPITELFGDF